MGESAREGRVLALIEAEFRADDPGLTALFDAFARHTPAPGAPRQYAAGQGHRRALAKRFLALLLVPLIAMTVLAMLSGRHKAANGWPSCPPPAAFGYPSLAGTAGCPAAGQRREPAAPVPAHIRSPAGTSIAPRPARVRRTSPRFSRVSLGSSNS